MRFPVPLIEGRLVRRYKRFLADVRIGDEVVVAHCANPGSMRTCAPDDAPVWLSESDNPKRKLRYSWELVESAGAMVGVHTGRANDLADEAIAAGVIAELRGYPTVRREVKVGDKSRIDFVLGGKSPDCYVEVKNVTLHAGGRVAAFPDSVTARGAKHLRELMTLREKGHRSVLLFICTRTETDSIRPADEIDPVYGETLREAASAGVEVLGYGCDISPAAMTVTHALPVAL